MSRDSRGTGNGTARREGLRRAPGTAGKGGERQVATAHARRPPRSHHYLRAAWRCHLLFLGGAAADARARRAFLAAGRGSGGRRGSGGGQARHAALVCTGPGALPFPGSCGGAAAAHAQWRRRGSAAPGRVGRGRAGLGRRLWGWSSEGSGSAASSLHCSVASPTPRPGCCGSLGPGVAPVRGREQNVSK